MLRRLLRALRNLLIALIVLGGLAFGALQALQNNQNTGQEGRAAQIIDETVVAVTDLQVSVNATGAVTPIRQVPLAFELPGTVAEVLVEEGDAVEAGAVLARLDTADLDAALQNAELALDLQLIAYEALTAPPRTEDLAVAEAGVQVAQASIGAAGSGPTAEQIEIARIQTEQARNQLWQAQLQRDLATMPQDSFSFSFDVASLIPDGTEISQETIDQINEALNGFLPSLPSVPVPSRESFSPGLTQAEFGVQIADSNFTAVQSEGGDIAGITSAQAALVAAQSQLDRLVDGASATDLEMAQLAVRQAELAVEATRTTVERGVLTAPFDGVVALNNLREGELPPTQGPSVLLVDQRGYYIEIAVDETDIVDIAMGQPVELRFDALPGTVIPGVVTRVAVAPTVLGQLVTYTVQVTLAPTNEPVRIGMSTTATIILDEVTEVLVLANRFIRIDTDTDEAFVVIENDAGRFEEVPVVLGLRSETESEIVSGLQAGDRVVLLPRAQFDLFGGN
ncbi:MAG: HlyD family efflux transporter periplasmic adaptor subunit [Chloroflexi bacterium]|nr:HlyD family efflux transporter periplasmic adaptor subunit [Chloroflexota bacterium]